MDLATLKTVFKFSSVFSSGLFFGGAVYVGRTHVPGLLAVKDISQSVVSFQYFWPRAYQMPLSAATAGLSGIAVYLIDRQKEDLPWLEAGLGMLSIMAYTGLVVYPYSIKQLMETDDVEDKEDQEIVSLFQKFNKYHHVRTAIAAGCFFTFTFYLYRS